MNKNSAVFERSEELQALIISYLILGVPLPRETPLPPIVMALQKNLIHQTNSPSLKQPWNQIKLNTLTLSK